MKRLDFLAVGDITTDAFIRLKDVQVHCRVDTGACELCVRFGDKIPYEFVEVVRAVGNSPNATVSVARLGLSSGLISNIGDDAEGKECVEVLKKERVDTSMVAVQKGVKTNYHYVLWFEAERTILVKHEKYDYKLPAIEPAPKWLYLSSLGSNSEAYHDELASYLEQHPEVKLAFQPGTFQMPARMIAGKSGGALGAERLKKLYSRSNLFFCNREEAQRILGLSEIPPFLKEVPKSARAEDFKNPSASGHSLYERENKSGTDMKKLLSGINVLGPKIVCITDGPKGAYVYDGYTNEYWFQPMYPDPAPPVSRTGAGDAFASTFTAARIWGKTVEESLRLAPINSAFVVQQIGAQKGLLSRAQLEKYLKVAPSGYAPQKI